MAIKIFKKNSTKIVSLALLAFVLSLALFLNMRYIQKKAKESNFTRVYFDDTFTLQKAFKYSSEGWIRYHLGKLFVQDYFEQKIIAFDTRGNILDNYYEKIPDGTETLIITWGVDEEGIYLVDIRRKLITHLGFDNELLHQSSLDIPIDRAGKLKGNQYIISTPDISTSGDHKLSIVKIDIKNNSKTQLNYPLAKVENSLLKYSGFYLQNSNGLTFYVCHMSGRFFCVDSDGQFQYEVQTIDKSPFPDILEQGPKLMFDPLSPIVNAAACADNEYLYILSRIPALGESLTKSSIIDAYAVENGQYSWSLKVDNFQGEKISKMTVGPDKFYFRQGPFITYIKKPKSNYL